MVGFFKGAIAVWYGAITHLFLCVLVVATLGFAQGGRSRSSSSTATSSESSDVGGSGKVVVRFMPHWSNTSAIMYVGGENLTMTAVPNYCGWFQTKTAKRASDFYVSFKQTIGSIYVGALGASDSEIPTEEEISLDSVSALSDTLWIRSFKSGEPEIYSSYPGVLGDCPIKNFPVTVFDWLHGTGGDGDGEGKNGNPVNGVSADFGSGGCSGSPMTGMVKYELGADGVPVPSDPFPSKCKITEHLAYWFLPESLAVDGNGNTLTNMTCRDITLSMDDEGFWLAEISKDNVSEGNEDKVGNTNGTRGMFLIDDFEYLDDANTVKNPYFDNIRNHNFGFTVKIQASFEYVPGQYFDFYGDDDVWVFIDRRLAVDIGGQHGQVAGAVLLDTIGQNTGNPLIPGEKYDFHIFYAERHTEESNFRMRTSIDLQVDASMFLISDKRGNSVDYQVWQINKKSSFACGNDNNSTEVDTTGGHSNFRLTGGNLDAAGVALDSIGTWFEGITILSDSTFSIDSAAIVDNYALAPGHYELVISLKADGSQSLKVQITVPSYKVPTLVYATESWKSLSKEVSGDTLQIGDWAYETYKVNIMFEEDWAQVSIYNSNISLAVSDPLVSIVDETGKQISKVKLDSTGRASFYVMANGNVELAKLTAKGAASSSAVWTNLVFKEPPIPRVAKAKMFDRNGDGRGDSLFIHFDKKLDSKNRLDSLKFTFGESFPVVSKYSLASNDSDVVVVSQEKCEPNATCGFSSVVFTGSADGIYTGFVDTWFTYEESGKEYHFSIKDDPVSDGVNPIVTMAKKTITGDGHVLSLTFSEGIDDSTKNFYQEMFEYVCIRSGSNVTPEKPAGYDKGGEANKMELLFTLSTIDAIVPSVGDSVGFVPGTNGSTLNVAMDLSGNKPHEYTPKVRITGEQDMSITGAGVIAVTPDNPYVSDTLPATTANLIVNKDLDAKDISDSLGVQGHLVGFDVAELMATQTSEDIANLDVLIATLLSGGKDDTTITVNEITEEESASELIAAVNAGEVSGFSEEALALFAEGGINADNYKSKLEGEDLDLFEEYVERGIEASRDTIIEINSSSDKSISELFDEIIDGTISEKELKNAGVSDELIKAIKEGKVNAGNLSLYREGSLTLVSPDDVRLDYETKYFSHLGHYVAGSSGSIACSDVSVYGEEGCLVNTGNLFLAWNMRSDNGRLAATGVYIARIHVRVYVGKKKVSDITRDLLWGVRRGSKNGIDLGSLL